MPGTHPRNMRLHVGNAPKQAGDNDSQGGDIKTARAGHDQASGNDTKRSGNNLYHYDNNDYYYVHDYPDNGIDFHDSAYDCKHYVKHFPISRNISSNFDHFSSPTSVNYQRFPPGPDTYTIDRQVHLRY